MYSIKKLFWGWRGNYIPYLVHKDEYILKKKVNAFK